MNGILWLLNLSVLVLLASMADTPAAWCLVLVGAVTGALLYLMSRRERRAERQQAIHTGATAAYDDAAHLARHIIAQRRDGSVLAESESAPTHPTSFD